MHYAGASLFVLFCFLFYLNAGACQRSKCLQAQKLGGAFKRLSEHCNSSPAGLVARADLNTQAPRVLCLLGKLKQSKKEEVPINTLPRLLNLLASQTHGKFDLFVLKRLLLTAESGSKHKLGNGTGSAHPPPARTSRLSSCFLLFAFCLGPLASHSRLDS
jgi:hypothetical protein